MLYENKNPMISGELQAIGGAQLDEGAIVARFAARVDALGPLSQVSKALQVHLLEEVKTIAQHLDGSTEAGLASRNRPRNGNSITSMLT